MTNTKDNRTYFGVTIWPADPNESGIRWEAMVKGGRLRSDTLAGIRAAIAVEKARWGVYWDGGK